MVYMSLFDWFVVSHAVGDFGIQTEFEALNKALGRFWNRALLAHCFKYTACFIPVFLTYHLNLAWLVLILGSHLFLDRRWPVVAWRTYVNRNSAEGIRATFWLTVVLDQIFHVLVIVLIVNCAS